MGKKSCSWIHKLWVHLIISHVSWTWRHNHRTEKDVQQNTKWASDTKWLTKILLKKGLLEELFDMCTWVMASTIYKRLQEWMGIKSFVRDKCVKMFSMSIWQVHEQGAVITILTMNIYARKLSTTIVKFILWSIWQKQFTNTTSWDKTRTGCTCLW